MNKKKFTQIFIRFLKEEKIYHETIAELRKYAFREREKSRTNWWYRMSIDDFINHVIYDDQNEEDLKYRTSEPLIWAFNFDFAERGASFWWSINGKYLNYNERIHHQKLVR